MNALELVRKSCALSLAAALGLAITSGAFAEGVGGGAKGLFFEQLEKPSKSINTGISYSIELKRDGQLTKVSNKHQFRKGDSIRFHVRSNIDGFSYILLSSGSRGESSVLFPHEKTSDDNHVERGRTYVLPSDGYLTFDENPGLEKLTLLLSRNPMDAQAYLAKPQKEVTMIASAQTGSKDLVPARIYVSYNAPKVEAPVFLPATTTTTTTNNPVKKAVVRETTKKTERVERVEKIAVHNNNNNDDDDKPKAVRKPAVKKHVTTASSNTSSSNHKSASDSDDDATVTVVSQQSSGVLHVDVALQHI